MLALTFLALASSPLLTIASPIVARLSPPDPGPYQAGAWKIDQDTNIFFFGDEIVARSSRFWLNSATRAYCPPDLEGLDCTKYPGGKTLFLDGPNGTLSLAVDIPGGQQVYVAPDGALSYTRPYMEFYPKGSITHGFSRSRSESFGAPVGLYLEGKQWALCPSDLGQNGTVTRESMFQIYLKDWNSLGGCLPTTMRTYGPTNVVAYSYE